MERQDRLEHNRLQTPDESLPDTGRLDQQRGEIDELLRAADHVFDSLNGLTAQQYLEQNLQSGGQ